MLMRGWVVDKCRNGHVLTDGGRLPLVRSGGGK